MYKCKIILILIMSMLILSGAYGQEALDNHLIKNVTGTVMSIDSVGNIISIRTADQKIMAFAVPEKTVITQDTHSIGLMDIGQSSSVTIQYFISPSVKNVVISIVDNESVVNE